MDTLRMEFPFPYPVPFAHRGAHGPSYAENSLAAVRRAADIGSPAVEFDICNLGDGTLVVSHDRILRLGGRRVDLTAVSSTQLAGGLPGVEPFLEVVADAGMLLNFDWKGSGHEQRVGELLRRYGLVERTIVSVGSLSKSDEIKRRHPEVRAGLSIGRWNERDEGSTLASAVVGWLDEGRCDALMLNHKLVSSEVVSTVRERGAGLFLWTVNSRREFDNLLRYAPDGVMTNAIAEHTSQRYS